MNYKLLLIVLLTFSLSSCSEFIVLFNPEKETIDEIALEFQSNHKATLEEEALFKDKYLKELSGRLVAIQHGSGIHYNLISKEVVAKTMDTLLDVKVNYILSNSDKNETIYFITYLTGTFVISNDSIQSRIVDQTLMSDAIYVDAKSNKIKIILVYNHPEFYESNMIVLNEAKVIGSQRSNIEKVFFKYRYYNRYLNDKRKLNPRFWNHIRHSPRKMQLDPKIYWVEEYMEPVYAHPPGRVYRTRANRF